MSVELSMTNGESLALAIALFQRQGLDAMPRKSRPGYPHVLIVRGVEDAQEDLVRGLALSVDPNAWPIVPPPRSGV